MGIVALIFNIGILVLASLYAPNEVEGASQTGPPLEVTFEIDVK